MLEGYLSKFEVRLLHSSGGQCTTFAAQAMVEYVTMLPADEVAEPMSDFESMRKVLVEMSKSSKAVDRRLQWMDEKLSGLRGLIDPLAEQRLFTRPSCLRMTENTPRGSTARALVDITGARRESESRPQSVVRLTTHTDAGTKCNQDSQMTAASDAERPNGDPSAASRIGSDWHDQEILGRSPMMNAREENYAWENRLFTDVLSRTPVLDARLFDQSNRGDLTPSEFFDTIPGDPFEPEEWAGPSL